MPRITIITLVFAVGAISTLLVFYALWQSNVIGPAQPGTVETRPATALLQAFQCRPSERKELILRGVEDAYALDNLEPAEMSEQAASVRYRSRSHLNMFDNSQADNILLEHAIVPSHISDGLVVIRMRPIIDNSNDSLQIGDMSFVTHYRLSSGYFHRYLHEIEAAGWTREGDVYSARISDIPFDTIQLLAGEGVTTVPTQAEHRTLLDYIRAGDGETVVDLFVQDDTSVDFWGIAACVQPEDGQGLTYLVRHPQENTNSAGLVLLAHESTPEHYSSNPYTGDTPCETALPLACFLDLDLPLPRQFDDEAPDTFVRRYWSGGIIAATPPVAASRFRSIVEADAHCAAEFGEDWRTLTYHDGGPPGLVLAYGGLSDTDQRYWVDIRGQPYGTCWAQE